LAAILEAAEDEGVDAELGGEMRFVVVVDVVVVEDVDEDVLLLMLLETVPIVTNPSEDKVGDCGGEGRPALEDIEGEEVGTEEKFLDLLSSIEARELCIECIWGCCCCCGRYTSARVGSIP
jgi:hypothetical protein